MYTVLLKDFVCVCVCVCVLYMYIVCVMSSKENLYQMYARYRPVLSKRTLALSMELQWEGQEYIITNFSLCY